MGAFSLKLKLLGRNTAIYAVGNVGMRAASFLLLPLYAHLLTKADFGLLCTVLFTVQIMLVLMSFGTRESLARFAAECVSEGRVGELLGNSLVVTVVAGAAVTGAALLALPLLGGLFGGGPALEWVLCSSGIALAQALAGQLMNHFRATNRPSGYVAGGVAVALLLLATNALFLWRLEGGIRAALAAQAISYGAVFLGMAAAVFPRTGLGLSRSLARRILAFGAPLVVSESSWFLMTGASVYFIGRYSGLEDVATFTLGYKLAFIIGVVLVLPLQLAFSPFVYSRLDSTGARSSISRSLTYYVFAFSAMSFGLLAGSRLILGAVAPEGYSDSATALVFILPVVGFYGLHNFGKTILHVRSRTGLTGAIAAGAGAVSLGLHLLLVPIWGTGGALVAVNLSSGLAALASLAVGLRFYPLRLEFGRIALAIIVHTGASVSFVLLRGSPDRLFYPAMASTGVAALALLWAVLHTEERAAVRAFAARLGLGTRPSQAPPNPSVAEDGD
jgi:O-antigen/teichoic acid export membrane protein